MEKYCWVVYKKDIFNYSKPMFLFLTKNNFKFGDLVEINDKGHIVKSKKKYLGRVVKNGKNLSLRDNFILFDRLGKKSKKEIFKGKDIYHNKINQSEFTDC